MKRSLIKLTPSKEDNERDIKIDINYNHVLFSTILKLINYSDPELADEIHNKSEHKLFTFLRIFSKNRQVKDGNLIFDGDNSKIRFFVSSVEDKIVERLMIGAIRLANIKFFNAVFYASYVKVIEPPKLLKKMKFKLLSPLVLSKPKEKTESYIMNIFHACRCPPMRRLQQSRCCIYKKHIFSVNQLLLSGVKNCVE